MRKLFTLFIIVLITSSVFALTPSERNAYITGIKKATADLKAEVTNARTETQIVQTAADNLQKWGESEQAAKFAAIKGEARWMKFALWEGFAILFLVTIITLYCVLKFGFKAAFMAGI